jgi:UDP-N-acetylmuramate--alanine ligase
VCGDDARLVEIARGCDRRVVTYGFDEACDVRCTVVEREGEGHRFETVLPDGGAVTCTTRVPGLHMVSNSVAALATAHVLQLDVRAAASALATFSGVRRRFDHVGECAGVTVVDDYAHHPTEVRATLEAASGLGYTRVWALFQPHRYSRTEAFSAQFGEAFEHADRVVLMDVYSAGETPIPGVTGKTLVDSTLRSRPRSRVAYLPHRADIVPYLVSEVRAGDLVMTMGAGDVTMLGAELLGALRAEHGR